MIPGGKLLRSWPLKGGISAGMTAFEVACPGDGTNTLVLRQVSDPPAAESEFKTLMSLQCLCLPVPIPRLLDPPYMITSFTDGSMDFSPVSADRIAGEMATFLVKLHTADLSKVDVHFLPEMSQRLARETQFAENPPIKRMDETRVRNFLNAGMLRKTRNPRVLLHGDYWPGNILWQNNKLVAVIDWEDAALGDPLADLAITRLDLRWIFGTAAMKTFTEKYLRQFKLDITDLPVWDLYAALRLIRLAGNDLPGWAAYFSIYGRPDITAETILHDYRHFIEHAMRGVQSMQIDSI